MEEAREEARIKAQEEVVARIQEAKVSQPLPWKTLSNEVQVAVCFFNRFINQVVFFCDLLMSFIPKFSFMIPLHFSI